MLIAVDRTTKKEDKKKDSLTLYHLQSALYDAIFPRIVGCKSAKEAWEALKSGFQGDTKVNEVKPQTLRKEFENLRMQEDEHVGDYCVRVKSIQDKMTTLGDTIAMKVV